MEKWPIFDQNQKHTPFNKSPFFDFFNVLFLYLRETFFSSRISENSTSWPILPKKKKKNGHFWTKTMVWKNVNFSTFWTSSLYTLQRRFSVLGYGKRYFPGLRCLKKRVRKMAIFWPKPWVQPFGKMSNFRLFGLLVFIA